MMQLDPKKFAKDSAAGRQKTCLICNREVSAIDIDFGKQYICEKCSSIGVVYSIEAKYLYDKTKTEVIK